MAKYRKKPVIIEAKILTERTEIETLEGVMVGEAGDYLITGVKGEKYPCKPDIFEKTYEPVSEEEGVIVLGETPEKEERQMRCENARSV